jgi:SAM-dependent methyltransferase
VNPSFRDPDGFVFRHDDRVLRCVHPRAVEDFRLFLSSPLAVTWMSEKVLPRTVFLADPPLLHLPRELSDKIPEEAVIVEHEQVWFVNYPYEWSPKMLYSAAELTLRLAETSSRAGFVLKDATPYNITFDGSRPVFLDLLSFARRDPLDPVWRPYAQFVRTFVYPLLANRYFGLRLDEMLLAHRDGLEPERIWRLCSLWRLLRPPFLGAVAIPKLLSGRGESPGRFHGSQSRDAGEADFLLGRLFRRANRLLRDAKIQGREHAAAEYMDGGNNYSSQELADKIRVVSEMFERFRPQRVLDIGCNTGHFSLLAARYAVRVVAIDHDPDVVDALSVSARDLPVLPLVVDIARPPGACGWENRESSSLLDRARQKFDCVLMLALIHHLLVNERVPLDRIFRLLAELTTRFAVVEYVDPADSQFQTIARGREALHRDLTRDCFEAAACSRFGIVERHHVSPTRSVYILQKEPS